jgi:rRNA maturation endonuclease Nob1
MEIFVILAIVLLVACALLLIFTPIWQQNHVDSPLPDPIVGQTYGEVEARYQATLASIKDLMFDYEMGKVEVNDYNQLLASSKTEAAKMRKQLDRLSQNNHLSPAVDAEIESLISQTRADGLNPQSNLLKQVDVQLARLKNGHNHLHTCPNCQGRVRAGDAYCPSCGHAIDLNAQNNASLPQHHCPQCGAAVQPNDAFCAGCGSTLDPLRVPQAENVPVI